MKNNLAHHASLRTAVALDEPSSSQNVTPARKCYHCAVTINMCDEDHDAGIIRCTNMFDDCESCGSLLHQTVYLSLQMLNTLLKITGSNCMQPWHRCCNMKVLNNLHMRKTTPVRMEMLNWSDETFKRVERCMT